MTEIHVEKSISPSQLIPEDYSDGLNPQFNDKIGELFSKSLTKMCHSSAQMGNTLLNNKELQNELFELSAQIRKYYNDIFETQLLKKDEPDYWKKVFVTVAKKMIYNLDPKILLLYRDIDYCNPETAYKMPKKIKLCHINSSNNKQKLYEFDSEISVIIIGRHKTIGPTEENNDKYECDIMMRDCDDPCVSRVHMLIIPLNSLRKLAFIDMGSVTGIKPKTGSTNP